LGNEGLLLETAYETVHLQVSQPGCIARERVARVKS
jgi:hypothetical protein